LTLQSLKQRAVDWYGFLGSLSLHVALMLIDDCPAKQDMTMWEVNVTPL
jgi:hypothetical protein